MRHAAHGLPLLLLLASAGCRGGGETVRIAPPGSGTGLPSEFLPPVRVGRGAAERRLKPLPPMPPAPETPEAVLRQLGSTDVRVCARALLAAARMNMKSAAPRARAILRAEDLVLAPLACAVLTRLEAEAADEALARALGSRRGEVRLAAARALGAAAGRPLSGAAERALAARALRDRDARVRAVGARTLGLRGSDRSIRALGRALDRSGEISPVRAECALALARRGDARGRRWLARAASTGHAAEAAPALDCLGDLGDADAAARLAAAARGEDPFLAGVAVDAAARLPREAARDAFGPLLAERGRPRWRAAVVLAPHDARGAAGALLEAVERADSSTRVRAARALGQAREARAVGVLVRVLAGTGTPGSVRTACARALAAIGSAEALESLRFAADAPGPGRREAVAALRELAAAEARREEREGR